MRTDEGAALAERTIRETPRSEGEAREFPDCRPVTMTREDIEHREGRIEFRDTDTETAWMVRESTAAAPEPPSRRLAGLGWLIAAVRGSPIEGFGTMVPLLRSARGERRRIVQANQSVCLHPERDFEPSDAGADSGR